MLFTGDTLYMESLADAYMKNGQEEEAKSTLQQLIAIEPEMAEKHGELIKNLFGDEGLTNSEGGPATNILGLNHVVLIDSDETNRTSIAGWLSELGIPETHGFTDGAEAWKHIEKQSSICAIITEWRIPSLTGPLIIQRIRDKFPSVPIILESSLLQNQDAPLVYEMGVAALIEKPFDKKQFLQQLISSIQQDRLPSDMETLERKNQITPSRIRSI